MRNQYLKLMLVTNKGKMPLDQYLNFIVACAKSGITSVQLREKNLNFNQLFEFGHQLKSVLKPFSIPLIINDNVDLAYQLDADGVHLGQSDELAFKARKKLGAKKIIGLSVSAFGQIYIANALPVNYFGVGPVYPTKSKVDVENIWGCFGLEKAVHLACHPIVAIGGINHVNAHLVMQAGSRGIAAIAAFHDAENPKAITKILRNIVDGVSHD
jgi:thiamine-phosphate pyrophosphorylase